MFNLNSLYMNDLIIMAAMLAVFGVWLLFHRLKNRRPADDDPVGKDFVQTKEQVEAYLTNVINPLLEKNQEVLGVKAEINV